jgi:predicted permease
MSLALLAAAGLFVRTLQNLQVVERGFRARNVVLVDAEGWRVNLPADVLDDVRRIPGVMVASIATHTPLSGASWSDPAVPMGQEVPERDNALFVGGGVGFFDALQVRILSGRTFENRDGSTAPAVAIVNEAYAARHFAGENPVGQQLSAKVRGEHRDLEIVGVATNVKASNLRAPASPTVYVPYAQLSGDLPATIVARVSGAMGTVAPAIQRTIQARVPGVLVDVKRLSEQVDSTLAQERLLATLAGGFGILALTITCVGLYGLLGYAVSQRTKELGIRLALGAQPPRVVAMVLSSGMRLVAIGVAIGLPAAWLGSRYVESMLFGLAPTDPLTIAGAIAMLFAAAQLAAYLPARRASRVDPLVALRHE